MAINQDTTVYGFNNIKETNNRVTSKNISFYGFNFPMGETRNSSYFELISGKKLFKKNLTQLMRTVPGERFMQPNFGLNLKKYLFEPVTQFILDDIRTTIRQSIQNYAPYLIVNEIEINSKSKSQAGFIADLIIKVKCTLKEDTQVSIDVNIEV